MSDNAISTSLLYWEAQIVLEALTREEERLKTVIVTSEDEDVIADHDEDLVKLRIVLNRLKKEAVAKFGERILNFNKGPL